MNLYGCDCLNEKLYNDTYNRAYNEYQDSIKISKEDLTQILGHWIPLYKYKENFYLYFSDCDFNSRGFTVSDSTYIEYYMDGPFPSLILNIEYESNKFEIHTDRGTKTLIRSESDPNIFVNTSSKGFLIHEKNINEFPLIAADCHELGAAPNIDFEQAVIE